MLLSQFFKIKRAGLLKHRSNQNEFSLLPVWSVWVGLGFSHLNQEKLPVGMEWQLALRLWFVVVLQKVCPRLQKAASTPAFYVDVL